MKTAMVVDNARIAVVMDRSGLKLVPFVKAPENVKSAAVMDEPCPVSNLLEWH